MPRLLFWNIYALIIPAAFLKKVREIKYALLQPYNSYNIQYYNINPIK